MSTIAPRQPHPVFALLEWPWRGGNLQASGAAHRWEVVKGWIGVVLALLALYGLWRLRGGYLAFINNSDILYPATFYWDWSRHRYPMHGWWLSPAPYFVPDLLLFQVLALITTHFAYAYLLYAIIILAGIVACMYWLAGWMNRSRADRVLAIGLILLLVAALCAPAGAPYFTLVCWLLAPMGHGGGLLAGLILLGLTLAMTQRVTPIRAVAFFLVTLIITVSDRLMLTEYLVPLLLVSLGYFDLRRKPALLIPPAIILVSTAIAAVASKDVIQWAQHHAPFFIPIKDPSIGDRRAIIASIGQFLHDVNLIGGRHSAMFILGLLSTLVAGTLALTQMVRNYRTKKTLSDSPGIGYVLMVSGFAWVLAITVPVIACVWENFACFRYLHSALIMPLVLLIMCGVWGLSRIPARIGAIAGSVIGLGILVFWLPVLRTPPVHISKIFYGPNVQFVDRMVRKHHLHNGYSGYWAAKPVFLFSKTGVMINVMETVRPEPYPQLWINNPNHWCHVMGKASAEYPIFDFVLCPSADEAKVVNAFGPPALVEQGEGLRMLIYNRPSDVVFRNFGRLAACNASATPLPTHVTPELLNHTKELYYPWDARDNIRLSPGKPLVVKLDPPIAGDVLEIMTHSVYPYDLDFRNGETSVGKMTLPPKPYGGMQPYHVALAPITGGQVFDSIVISPPATPGDYSVTTVQVLTDPLRQPESSAK